MAGITLDTAKAHLEHWLEADKAVATGQSYTIGSRALTRADAAEIRSNIDYWERKVKTLSRGGGFRRVQVVPL
ncbi:DUF6148 family protein [Geovibrio ferrireducens]|uniref:DUF6148 family protein n=1 Tax=Geovibrio ferrireducens TaxID=46201 RepID=UPI002246DFE1|nr:DUF6148 family protein [Geovibrio ferrireducens]